MCLAFALVDCNNFYISCERVFNARRVRLRLAWQTKFEKRTHLK